jgi:hypothetical protein
MASPASERDVLEHLVARFSPAAVILVGSRADGVSRSRSDWDLYVLLREDGSHAAGVTPAPEIFRGEHLDVGLARLPIPADGILALFGPNLQQARVLLDDEHASARKLCERAARLYAAGRKLTREERERREHELRRNVARMRARAGEPGAFLESVAFVFHLAHRSWYEILHDRWSLSVHRAMPEIAREDPQFHERLVTLAESPSPEARIAAAEAILERLFAA